jgi:hypothetical protein
MTANVLKTRTLISKICTRAMTAERQSGCWSGNSGRGKLGWPKINWRQYSVWLKPGHLDDGRVWTAVINPLSTPNITTNSVKPNCTSAPFVRSERKVVPLATPAARITNEATVAPMVGSGGVCVCRNSGIRPSALCRGVWQASGFNSCEEVFRFLILFIKKFYQVFVFNALCKDNAAINCSTIQEDRVYSPLTSTGSCKASTRVLRNLLHSAT